MLLASLAFACQAPTVIDGDTLRCVNVPEANGRVRLARIDAPERGEAGADEATRYLSSLLVGDVHCRSIDADPRKPGFQRHDRYGRRVARCKSGGRDLGQSLLDRKLAVPWP